MNSYRIPHVPERAFNVIYSRDGDINLLQTVVTAKGERMAVQKLKTLLAPSRLVISNVYELQSEDMKHYV